MHTVLVESFVLVAIMDNILRPDFFYPERKQIDCLSEDLPARAESYFAQLFDKAGDGVLLLMGDLEEEALKLRNREPRTYRSGGCSCSRRECRGGRDRTHGKVSLPHPT